jgi:hypothetical protein
MEQRMIRAGLFAGLGAFALLAGCAEKPAPRPEPAPAAPPPRPAPEPVPPPAALDWRDVPLSPGEWRYADAAGAPEARFDGANGGFVLRCDRVARRLVLAREGEGGGAMTIRTSAGARSFPAANAVLPASDSFLDAMAFSRGRFTVEAAGLPMLVVPAWPEPARVVQDCRS